MSGVLARIKTGLGALVSAGQLVVGFIAYLATGRTPAFAHMAMIRLFCSTGGSSNDLLSRMIGSCSPPYAGIARDNQGLLGAESRADVLRDLRANGYHVFSTRLPDELCDRLLQFAVSRPSTLRPMDGEQPASVVHEVYSRSAPRAVRYDFPTQVLLANEDVQALLADPSFAAVAQDYLGSRPVLDVLSMWWHTAFSDQPDKEAAQFFHFDMDRPKWLKFFIYLTDVETFNGPHTFVEGSHGTGGIPRPMLRKGYARLADEEVVDAFGAGRLREFTGRRGTIIAEDTRGLHKGKHVQSGDRLLLQLQFSNSLFGASYEKARMVEPMLPGLKAYAKAFPGIFRAYT